MSVSVPTVDSMAPITHRGSWVPGSLADALPRAGQLAQRARGTRESLCPWWLLDAWRVIASGHLHPSSRTDPVKVEGLVRGLQTCV